MCEPIRILIVDDHKVVRMGLQAMLATKPEVEILGEACDGIQAVQKACSFQPDVILMDLMMPNMGGLEAISEIRSKAPNSRILVLTSFSQEDKLFMALNRGAMGFLLKDSSPEELFLAIQTIHRGQAFLGPSIATKFVHTLNRQTDKQVHEESLTDREEEVLGLLAQGKSNQKIANVLNISKRTVGAHVSSILDKLNLENRTQAALYAYKRIERVR